MALCEIFKGCKAVGPLKQGEFKYVRRLFQKVKSYIVIHFPPLLPFLQSLTLEYSISSRHDQSSHYESKSCIGELSLPSDVQGGEETRFASKEGK